MVDRTSAPDYKPPLPAPVLTGSAQVAQLVEHATENRSVGGSIPPLGTISPMLVVRFSNLSHMKRYECGEQPRANAAYLEVGRWLLRLLVSRQPLEDPFHCGP